MLLYTIYRDSEYFSLILQVVRMQKLNHKQVLLLLLKWMKALASYWAQPKQLMLLENLDLWFLLECRLHWNWEILPVWMLWQVQLPFRLVQCCLLKSGSRYALGNGALGFQHAPLCFQTNFGWLNLSYALLKLMPSIFWAEWKRTKTGKEKTV